MTDNDHNHRPSYLYPGGSPVMHTPLQLKQSQMYGFFVRGDLAKLQATVDSTLTAVAGGEMHFQVLSPFVMLTFTRVGRAYSSSPEDQAKGWGEETDIVTWVMVGQVKKGEPGISHVFFYPCHIFVDDGMALINGRELFGYPKYLCEYVMPEAGEPADYFSLSAKGFEPFSPESRLRLHPLLDVATTTRGAGARALGGLAELVEEAIELLGANLPAFLALNPAGWAQIADMLRQPGCDQIFLKQFPDTSGVKAVYQAIVAAPAQVTAVHGVELLLNDYELTLHRFASFPLNDTLGLALGPQRAILPFHIHFDFEVTPGEVLHDNSVVPAPKKIAILGGGVAAMTSAFYLTEQPGWQDQYEITVYQTGWRLGGKGASGRNAAIGQRIEEHGLHIWFGFYQNAFKTIQRAYALLDRPAGTPLATWQDAFKPQHAFCLSEDVRGEWRQWLIDTPVMPGEPGHGDENVSLWDIALTVYAWVKMWLDEMEQARTTLHANQPAASLRAATPPAPEADGDWLEQVAQRIQRPADTIATDVHSAFDAALALVETLPPAAQQQAADRALQASALQGVRRALRRRLEGDLAAQPDADDLRHLTICIEIALATMIGMLEDGVFVHGFDVINDIDLRAWLARHGAPPMAVDSAPIRGLYDLVFAYVDGDPQQPNIEAGTMLRGMFRMTCGYQGGIMWKMQAGMGDAVFTPFYEVLKRRGVRFKFFHQVEALVPHATDAVVDQIRITRQVDLASGDYAPLVSVKGLDCWPSQPLYEQLDPAQAALLQAGQVNLESHWSNWPALYQEAFGRPLPTVTLQRGVDFDEVVFAIAADGLALLCPELVARSPALQASATQVKTTATQAYQVWLDKTLEDTGWCDYGRNHEQPVLTAFTEPMDTWSPMDQTLPREDWPAPYEPRNVSYFCSALPVAAYPPFSDHQFPRRMAAQVKENALHQLNTQIHALWPSIATPSSFDWSTLVDMNGGTGPQRFDSQYWRANIDPSERYVLSVVNSTQYRLATDGTGFRNFFVTGDWIRTGINAGCVEAAVMAGMQTSRAICGFPQKIAGESDL